MTSDWLPISDEKHDEYREATEKALPGVVTVVGLWAFVVAMIAAENNFGLWEAIWKGTLIGLALVVVSILIVIVGFVVLATLWHGTILVVGYLLVDFPEKVRGWSGRG